MTFCPECGKPVAPKAKFCRICGASQMDDASSAGVSEPVVAPVAAPAPSPAPAPAEIPAQPPASSASPVTAQPASQSVCGSCGSPLALSEKFCGICGARAGQAVPSAPPAPYPPAPVYTVPAPVSPPAPAMGQYPSVRTCTSCGNVIRPGDKYCSKCLVIVRDNPPQAGTFASVPAPVPVPASSSYPSPAPVPAQSPGIRNCGSCGNVIKPGDKYCSKCLAIVRDNSPQAPAPAPFVMQPSPAAAPGSYVCASCGSPVSGTEKFCGICGATIVAARIPAAAQPQPVQKTCSACGAPVNETTKFCGGCGAPVGASFRPAAVVPPFPVPAAPAVPMAGTPGTEEILGVIGNARKMKMFGASWDTFTIVVTSRRMVLAQLTTQMMNAAVMDAQQQAKAEGKGFFGIVKDQLTATYQFAQRYETMPAEQTLAETTGNFAIENARITAIHLKLHGDSDDGGTREFKMIIESNDGKYEYIIAENERFVNILKTAYSERVHMPFGYINVGIGRIKLF